MNDNIDLFIGFDFSQLDSSDFKEDSVREVIILPILEKLGYKQHNIIRSKSLQHPYLKIGVKKRPITLIPDYLLKVHNSYAWVLDAKNPNEIISSGDHIEQVYSYASHPEIRTNFFALCNGREFVLFRKDSIDNHPILSFQISEIANYWDVLYKYLAITSFQIGNKVSYQELKESQESEKFKYNSRPLLKEIKVKKQAAKRHFGCNAYFTRQSWDVVAAYIRNYTVQGDIVLDPFGGSGVTAIESMMNDRKAIHIDINPLSVFIVKSLAIPVEIEKMQDVFERIKKFYYKNEPNNEIEISHCLNKYQYPKGYKLPKGSDVEYIEELFTQKQLAQLALLKYAITKEAKKEIKESLLLAFYNTISVINKTFHDTPKGGGNHFGYYYRYRIAPNPAYKNTFKVFENKFKRIIEGKKEINTKITCDNYNRLTVFKGSCTNLFQVEDESVDYIYTDPPYGKKIAYLDLSIIWNAWLDLEVTKEDYKLEAIEGGELKKTKNEYCELISQSIREIYRVLKYDRWLSFVFQHKDPEFWHLIKDTAERCGFEYAGTVQQKNGQTSFKKRQNPFTVLSGELIINFKKVKNPRTMLKANLGMDISEIIIETIEGIIAQNDGATIEQINNGITIKGLELGFIHLLRSEIIDSILKERFEYNDQNTTFTIKKNSKFQTHIDLELRIKYYLISFLRRMELEGKIPDFDDIVLNIMPLLKNGITPEHQTILKVLEDMADRVGKNGWKLHNGEQLSLF